MNVFNEIARGKECLSKSSSACGLFDSAAKFLTEICKLIFRKSSFD